MSLHALATNMASKGRNGDSMLVHMTPGEVHGLQALAMKHGGSLTTNPDTGLPEANFLKSLLPMLAGFALNAFVPGLGAAVGGMFGASAAVGTGIAVGGITGLATGSLSKGLMAGLGAYGGAGLQAGLAGAGADALTREALSVEGALPSLENITQVTGEGYGGSAANYSDQVNSAVKAARDTASGMPTSDLLSAGAKATGADPMGFARQNMMPLAAAAAPIMAGMMVPTTTKAAPVQSPGRIREKRWDGRQFVDVASTDAGVYNTSGRSFSDLYRGYNGGGIVALAGGGDVKRYAIGRLVEGGPLTGGAGLDMNNEIYKYFSDPATQALLASGNDKAVAQALQDRNYSLADVAKATGTQDKLADYERRFTQAVNTPTTDATEFLAATTDVGLQNQGLATALSGSGLSAAGQYASTHNLNDAAGITTAPKTAQDFYTNMGYTAGALPGDKGGLEGLYANINYSAKGLQDQINAGTLTVEKAQALARGEMGRVGVSEKDIKNATGVDFANLFKDKTTVTTVTGGGGNDTVTGGTGNAVVVPSGYHLENGVLVKNISATQNTTETVANPTDLFTAPAAALPVGVSGNTGPSQIGGGATVNPNGTITTSPRIPGIDVGGFTGIKGLRDAYTKGGGSLGYTSPKFDSLEDFNKKYVTDRMSGDSLAAYEYLSGKKGAKYPTKSGVGQISEDYATAVLGYPARGNLPYTYNKATGKMDPNPDYVAPGRDAAGNVTYSMSLNDIKKSLTDAPLSGQALYDWAKSNNLSAQQIADATGRSLSSVYSDFRAGSKAKADKATDAAKGGDTIQVTDSSGYNTETVTATKQADGTYLGSNGKKYDASGKSIMAGGGIAGYAAGGMPSYALGGLGTLGGYSDGGRLLKGPGDGVSDSIPATIGRKQQPARLADGEFVVPARIVSELGNGSTDAGAKKLYAMLDRVQRARGKTTGKNKVAANSRADKYLPA